MRPGPTAPPRMPALRVLIAVGLVAAALLLLLDAGALLRAALAVLPHPYEFDYGEGIVWQQQRDLFRGRAYGPLGVFPAIVYHYPPVFYAISEGLARGLGLDGLLAGRLVSLLATLACAVLVGVLTREAVGADAPRPVRLACAALAGLSCFAAAPVVGWALLMRVDMLACALSLGGLALVTRAVARPGLIAAAALAFVLAVYTKQVSIAAPAAAFVVLWRVRRDLAWRLAALCGLFGGVALALLAALTDGGFLRHAFLYNANRIEPWRLVHVWTLLGGHAVLVALGVIGLGRAWPRLRAAWTGRGAGDGAAVALLLAAAYLALKTLLLPMIVKVGAAENYFIEWSLALAVFVGLGLRPALALALGGGDAPAARLGPALALLVLFGLPAQALRAPGWDAAVAAARADRADKDRLVALIAASGRPVVADDMTLPIRAGRDVSWEPAIAAELAHAGRYDEAAFAALIRAGTFGFFATAGRRGDGLFDERYNPPVAAALAAAYPETRPIGSLTLHLPRRREACPGAAC